MPSLSLPKGGGAIRGIGEKFSTNPATGTSSLSIPIATSSGRAGFELGLQLSYDSGGGNGPFGLGWSLSVPAVTHKTDKGLPRYGGDDEVDSPDVFVLSGAEDLVPVQIASGTGTRPDVVARGDHRVARYRPRTEGLYARIERWTHLTSGDTHWRATTRDNVLNIYGRTAQARVADPEHPERVFSWLLEETRDDRGNVVRYSYKAEDGAGVHPGKTSEANRFEVGPGGAPSYRATAQRYLKRVQYGNRTPLLDREAALPEADSAYLFEVVLDYGEHDALAPTPAETWPWAVRQDPFSMFRATFEVRTLRLCQRVLMFHRFAELGPAPCLVRSTDFTYDEGPAFTYLVAATQAGYQRTTEDAANGAAYVRATLPPLSLGYARAELARLVTRFAYHHGYFDGVEREFHGFGCVEQWDAESFGGDDGHGLFPELLIDVDDQDPALNLPPVRTVTWFHTGAWLEREALERELAREYYQLDPDAPRLPDTLLPAGLTVREEREAARALRGQILRQEIYAEDDTTASPHPYSVSERNHEVRLLQRAAGGAHAVFCVHPRHTIELHYERNPSDPRTQHQLVLEVDDFGNTTKAAAIAYPRRVPLEPEQARLWATYTESTFANRPDERDWYRAGVPIEVVTRELTGLPVPARSVLSIATVLARAAAATEIPYEAEAASSDPAGQRRIIERERKTYLRDDLSGPLPLGQLESRALAHESYKLALTPGLLTQVYGERLAPELLEAEGGYLRDAAGWWAPSGHVVHDPARFYLAVAALDPFGQRHLVRYDDHALLPVELEDPLGNRSTVGTRDAAGAITSNGNDYRTLLPALLTDANRNRSAAAFDALGMVVATAVMGKEGELVGDRLEGFAVELSRAARQAFLADPHGQAAGLLGSATSRIVYDLDRYARAGQPACSAVLLRETHLAEAGGAAPRIQLAFSYSDGSGHEVQKKLQAEGGEAPLRQPDAPLPSGDREPGELVRDAQGHVVLVPTTHRWVGTGRTVLNNKGKPVKQYEPFFSSTPLYEAERELTDTGVTPVLFYDPAERVVATLHPNHTYEKVVFDAWQELSYDGNDTVAAVGEQTGDPRTDPDVEGYVRGYFATQPSSWETWYEQRVGGQLGAAEREAAQRAALHGDTPTIKHVDALGRGVVTVAINRFLRNGVVLEEAYATRVQLDIEHHQRAVTDARGRVVMRYRQDVLSRPIHQASMEAGERWMLNDVTGKPLRAWDSRGFVRRMTYDALRRPTGLYVLEGAAGGAGGIERLAERTVYGEGRGDATNHRTRAYQVFDGAGVVTSVAYDFKGNLLEGRRELLPTYKLAVDWQQSPAASDGSFTTRSSYDALNRPVTSTTPDGSVQRPVFNEANLLDQVQVQLRGAAAATPVVANLDYDAKGQRVRLAHGNGAVTTYQYDPLTFRLIGLRTTRPASPDATASLLFRDVTVVQDLHYTYDPVGNLTRIEDAALRTVFYDNQQVDPLCRYTYDAVYRLIEAQGREHLGQNAFDLAPSDGNYRDYPLAGHHIGAGDAQALRNYTQRYEYDAVGNFEVFRHLAGGSGWTRRYEYNEASLLEPGKVSNRLSRTILGSSVDVVERYTHDAHGSMTSMPHLAAMAWDFKDQLQRVNLGGGGTAYYVYDAAGQRVRKVIESVNGARQRERLYLGGFEIHREYGAGATVTLARESLHLMDDKQRVALVETLTVSAGTPVPTPAPQLRYQLGNHLGSASLELDLAGAVISYEEYHPYGTSSLQAGRSAAEVSLKRYRYTGKERDEETGFSYHGARYYAPWVARWTSCDPLELSAGINIYLYAANNPITFFDPDGKKEKPFTPSGTCRIDSLTPPTPNNRARSKPDPIKLDPGSFEKKNTSLGKFSHGNFDVKYNPSKSELRISLRVEYKFEHGISEYDQRNFKDKFKRAAESWDNAGALLVTTNPHALNKEIRIGFDLKEVRSQPANITPRFAATNRRSQNDPPHKIVDVKAIKTTSWVGMDITTGIVGDELPTSVNLLAHELGHVYGNFDENHNFIHPIWKPLIYWVDYESRSHEDDMMNLGKLQFQLRYFSHFLEFTNNNFRNFGIKYDLRWKPGSRTRLRGHAL